jgi:hypothetical protein
MRLLAGILVCALAAPGISADPATRQRLIRYFGGWYSFFPGSRVSVAESGEIVLPGLEAYACGATPSRSSTGRPTSPWWTA